MNEEKHPGGRPSLYTPELSAEICAQLATGKSLRTIVKEEGMPAMTTIFRWLGSNEEFRKQYARAKEESADAMVEEILDIADDGTNDWMERTEQAGGKGFILNGEHVQRSRLRIDTRKWIASKLKPKKYGEKIEHSTPDGQPLLVFDIIHGSTKDKPDSADKPSAETADSSGDTLQSPV